MTKSIRTVAMDILARREHSQRELHKKLATKGYEDEAITSTLQSLFDEGLQSDTRFAESYLNARQRSGFGPVRIRQELSERGVSSDVLATLFSESAVDWLQQARDVCLKKFGCIGGDLNAKAKQLRFLQYRGFEVHRLDALMEIDESSYEEF